MTEKFKRHTEKSKRNKTLGKMVVEKNEEYTPEHVSVTELIREANKDYGSELRTCIDNGKKIYDNDFFIEILYKVERLMQDVNRLYFIPRLSCPTPNFDQHVYKYHRGSDMLEFIWVVPDKDTCNEYRYNINAIPDDEIELRNYVLDFYDGTLETRAKKLNNENINDPRIAIRIEEN
jgi:hypothetical protein